MHLHLRKLYSMLLFWRILHRARGKCIIDQGNTDLMMHQHHQQGSKQKIKPPSQWKSVSLFLWLIVHNESSDPITSSTFAYLSTPLGKRRSEALQTDFLHQFHLHTAIHPPPGSSAPGRSHQPASRAPSPSHSPPALRSRSHLPEFALPSNPWLQSLLFHEILVTGLSP